MSYYRDSPAFEPSTYDSNYDECSFHCYDTKSGWSDK